VKPQTAPTCALALAVLLATGPAYAHNLAQAGTPADSTPAAAAPPAAHPHDASYDEYRQHLTALKAIVDSCAKYRDIKACDPAQVGVDDRVPVSTAPNAERRLVRYGWLRVLLSRAQDKDTDPSENGADAKKQTAPATGTPKEEARPPKRTTTQLLIDAKDRLAGDLAQIDKPSAETPAHAEQRAVMNQVLAGRDFANLEEPTAKDSALEKVGNWLNKIFDSAARLTQHSAWVGRVLVWGFILAICIGLVWGLMQLERRWRVRLVPDDHAPAPGAASARDWQLWLEDARRAAAAGLWREAIHFVYWASISRLESRRLWPADRARTPREYLALVAADDARKPGLTTLTGSFERVWYGGRPAGETDYRKAEEIASALIAGSTPAVSTSGGSGR
jgi:hypothetical protein